MSVTQEKLSFCYHAKKEKKWLQVFAHTKKEAKRQMELLGYTPKSAEIFVGKPAVPTFH